MKKRTVVTLSIVAGLAVAVVPWLFPTGPSTGLGLAHYLSGGRLVAGTAIVFLGGLLTACTPCVYPLIPITLGIFGARKDTKRSKALLLTSTYVLGIAVVFTVLGTIAARSGMAFGALLGNRWVAVGLAAFFLALAASMFGAFELALPSGLNQKLNSVGGQGLVGAFLMGAVSGFIAAPCTGPVLGALLAFVAATQSLAVGALLLFVYALGVGFPFMLIGVFALKLPRSGAWMEAVKSVLGLILVLMAAVVVQDAFPSVRAAVIARAGELGREPGTWIAALVATAGVLVGAIHHSFHDGRSAAAKKAVGLLLVTGALVLRGGAMNAGPVGTLWVRAGWVKPPKAPEVDWALRFDSKQGIAAFDTALAQAKAEGRPVMIDFFAEWCAACKELDRKTYVAPDVAQASTRFVNIKVDATADDDLMEKLFSRFGVQGLPTVAFIASSGEPLQKPRVTGFLAPEQFLGELARVR